MADSLKDKSITAFLWVLINKVGNGGINFLVTIVLARLLSPEDFGLVAMVMIVFEFSYTFVESGFMPALIREKTISDLDKSTTFIFNLVSAVLIYALIFVSAPWIAAFFNEEGLLWIVRVMGLNLLIASFAIVQRATLTQKIDFKTLAKTRLAAVVISGSIAVTLAWNGFGVWSLVVQYVVMSLIDTISLWVLNRWTPQLKFSMESFRRLFGFGSKILLSSILDKFFQQIYKLIIGKYFSAATLGYFQQADNFKMLTISTLYNTIKNVSYPVLAKLQDDRVRLKEGYRKFIKLSSFIIVPAMTVLGVMAEPILVNLVGEKWLPSVPFLQLLCLSGVTYHFSQINMNVLLVLGRSDLSLKLEIIKKITITIAIIIGIKYGIYGLVIGEVISAYINLLINTYYSSKFLQYSFYEQVKDVSQTILFSLLIGTGIYFSLSHTASTGMFYMVFTLALSGIAYLGLHFLVRSEEILFMQRVILPKMAGIIRKGLKSN